MYKRQAQATVIGEQDVARFTDNDKALTIMRDVEQQALEREVGLQGRQQCKLGFLSFAR